MDTHAAVRNLENAGFESKHAEAIVAVVTHSDSNLVTKSDLKSGLAELKAELKTDNANLKAGLITWMVGTGLAFAGLIIAAVKL